MNDLPDMGDLPDIEVLTPTNRPTPPTVVLVNPVHCKVPKKKNITREYFSTEMLNSLISNSPLDEIKKRHSLMINNSMMNSPVLNKSSSEKSSCSKVTHSTIETACNTNEEDKMLASSTNNADIVNVSSDDEELPDIGDITVLHDRKSSAATKETILRVQDTRGVLPSVNMLQDVTPISICKKYPGSGKYFTKVKKQPLIHNFISTQKKYRNQFLGEELIDISDEDSITHINQNIKKSKCSSSRILDRRDIVYLVSPTKTSHAAALQKNVMTSQTMKNATELDIYPPSPMVNMGLQRPPNATLRMTSQAHRNSLRTLTIKQKTQEFINLLKNIERQIPIGHLKMRFMCHFHKASMLKKKSGLRESDLCRLCNWPINIELAFSNKIVQGKMIRKWLTLSRRAYDEKRFIMETLSQLNMPENNWLEVTSYSQSFWDVFGSQV